MLYSVETHSPRVRMIFTFYLQLENLSMSFFFLKVRKKSHSETFSLPLCLDYCFGILNDPGSLAELLMDQS